MGIDSTPLYLNWQFWSAVVALIALVLSQFQPVKFWFRSLTPQFEVQSRVRITHKVGNPNLSMYVSIRNSGGRDLHIRRLSLSITRETQLLGNYPAVSYFEESISTFPALFVPFSLNPMQSWTHNTIFLREFDRLTEKEYRKHESTLRSDINNKLATRLPGDKSPVVADECNVKPFHDFFDKMFIWLPDEYKLDLTIVTSSGKKFIKPYRFTLFESDSEELKSYQNDYKYGGGIYFEVERHMQLIVPLSSTEEV